MIAQCSCSCSCDCHRKQRCEVDKALNFLRALLVDKGEVNVVTFNLGTTGTVLYEYCSGIAKESALRALLGQPLFRI